MAGEKQPHCPTELTEFPPLSSDSRPSGGFFNRFFKRNTEDTVSASTRENTETCDTSPVTDPPAPVPPNSLDVDTSDTGDDDKDDRVSVTSSGSAAAPNIVTSPRTLSGVLKRVSNILERRSQTPQAYKDSDFKQYWMPDSNCRQCYECGDRFNTFRRRHHCRICGQIFCSRCCNQVLPGRIMGYTGYLRVCTYCCKVVLSYAQNPEATGSLWDLSEDIRQHLLVSPDAGHADRQGSATSGDVGWWELQSKILQRRQSTADDQGLSNTVDLTPSSSNPFDSARQLDYTATDSFLEERRVLLRDSAQLRELWLLIQHPIDGIAMASHRHRLRTYPNCLVGSELVDWLLTRDKATSRVQATVIGQALVDAKWLECITSSDQTFRDMYALYRAGEAVLTESPLEEPKTQTTSSEEEAEPEWFRDIKRQDEDSVSLSELNKIPSTIAAPDKSDTVSSSIFYIALEAESNALGQELLSQAKRADIFSSMSASSLPAMAARGERDAAHSHQLAQSVRLESGSTVFDEAWIRAGYRDSNEAGYLIVDTAEKNFGVTDCDAVVADDIGEHYVSTEMESGSRGWLHTEALSEKNDERLAYARIMQTQRDHMAMLTSQLLGKEKLSMKWADLILCLVRRITHLIQPELRTDGREMDIRHYVKIKKVAGSTKTHTGVVSGVVCTKNVSHKQMRQQISHATILLLQCPIVYQRVENKFSSLEPQILQEEEFLKNCVARIAAVKPDILLVGKSVSRVAQSFLLDCDITLVLNVKQSVMERVARFTHAEIVKSIDGLVSKTALGFCNLFKLQNFTLPDGQSKTLMYFDGCSPHLGCTVILRGGSAVELSKVKKVLQFMMYASYHLRLELSFLMDEFAMPPQPPADNSLGIADIDGSSDSVSANDAKSCPCHSTDSDFDNDVKSGKTVTGKNSRSVAGEESGDVKRVRSVERSCVSVNRTCVSSEAVNSTDKAVGSTNKAVCSPKKAAIPKNKAVDSTGNHTNKAVNSTNKAVDSPDKAVDPTNEKAVESADRGTHSRQLPTSADDEKNDLAKMRHVTDASDPLHDYQRSKDESIFDSHSELREVERTSQHFKDALSDVILAVSPFVRHDLPYLLTNSGAKCWLRQFFPENMFCSELLPNTTDVVRGKSKAAPVFVMDGREAERDVALGKEHDFITQKLTASAGDCHIQTCLADFRARGGRVLEEWSHYKAPASDPDKNKSRKKLDCLDPFAHQRLAVCFSSFSYESANAPNPCVYPWVVTMDYHGTNVITLGDFLERYCFRESYMCPSESCDTPMVNHIRRFVHGRGSLQVLLKRLDLPIPGSNTNIVMWSWCRHCKQVTPVVPMSLDTWSMSFAKYLELRFHGDVYGRRACTDPCPHSIHHDHYQYFGLRQIVASFKYSPINLKEISLPPVRMEIEEQEINLPALTEATCCLATQGANVYSSILHHLHSFRPDPSVSFLTDYITQIQAEKEAFQKKIRVLLEDCDLLQEGGCSLFELQDLMVEIKRLVAEAIITWGGRIMELEQLQRKPEKMRVITPASRITKATNDNGTPPQVQVVEIGAKVTDVEQTLEDQSSSLGGAVAGSSPMCPTEQTLKAGGPFYLASMPGEVKDPTQGNGKPVVDSLRDTTQSGCPDPGVTGQTSTHTDRATPPKILIGSDTTSVDVDRAVDSAESDADRVDGQADGHVDSRPDGGKMNTMKNIFNKVLSSSGSLPIPMPFAPDEHLLLQPPSEKVPLIIYDKEPSSIIAYSLSSPDYSSQLDQLTQDGQDTSTRRGGRNSDLGASPSSQDTDAGKKTSSVLSFFRGSSREKSPNRLGAVLGKYSVDSVKYMPRLDQDSAEETDGAVYAGPDSEVRKPPKKEGPDVNQHIELQFSDSSARFYCRIYFAEQFQKLRRLIFPSGEERFIRSLSRCYTWMAMGGKSGLTFCKTQDDRFILKQMSRYEVQSFMDFAPHYFAHVTKAFNEKKPTALAKILGVYRIGYRNTQTNAALKQDLLVMENLFYNRDITQVFDLKGSVRNRLVNTSGKRVDELVLLDENLLKSSIDSPLYIRPHSKFVLNSAINNDTHFLSSHIVMDYSLLVGLDTKRNELVVGIIDYIRTFTWDKRMEMVVKSTYSQWGGQGKMPTVVSPELYRKRFLQAMNRYFLLVPDQWTGLDTVVN